LRYFSILAACAAVVASPVAAQSVQATSPAVARDVQCFILYAAAAGSTSGDEQTPGLLGTAYFIGKLKAEAPDLDLLAAARGAVNSLQTNPQAKAIGASCDDEIAKFGEEMSRVGSQLDKSSGQLSSSSSS
jgi:hypothetical protein